MNRCKPLGPITDEQQRRFDARLKAKARRRREFVTKHFETLCTMHMNARESKRGPHYNRSSKTLASEDYVMEGN